ncbi:hypothetical protein [Micromonospora costi]|uniref:Uncharacterized protein n=1 Tax=Micromonospora costi TaxID=1530042 RepID=A0A3B0A772_9ACTN|nr:hypothetical protein [Micromonospora costi]RKN56024.1 hypothetical protein D7193_15845 [Micromonospora costi]
MGGLDEDGQPTDDLLMHWAEHNAHADGERPDPADGEHPILGELSALVDLLASGKVPTPHGIHLNFEAGEAAWVRVIAANPAVVEQVGLRPQVIVAAGRVFNGTEHVEVRLSWVADQDIPDQGRVVAAVRALTGLLLAGGMPVPLRVDAMHALTRVGLMAQRIVDQTAAVLDERPTWHMGSVFVVKRLGRWVSYTMHGFLR